MRKILGVFCGLLACGGGNGTQPKTHSISGTISGRVASGVTVTLSGASAAPTVTDTAGNYSFPALADGSYTVTPSLAGGYAFTPASAPAAVRGADVTGVNFSDTGEF